jgi:aminopeptidase N
VRPFALVLLGGAVAAGPVAPAARAPRPAPTTAHHSLKVALDPGRGRLSVTDTITLPPGGAKEVEFLLGRSLALRRSEPAATEMPLGDAVRSFGLDALEVSGPAEVKRYRVDLRGGGPVLSLEYEGPFDFGLAAPQEEYTRGFHETRGIVSSQGVYLAGDGFWYPRLGDDLLEFDMDVALPEGWHVVSEGDGTSRDEKGVAHWDSHGPTEEIHLVGGPLRVYRGEAGAVETLVYLHERDDALAARYLKATAQYLEMYGGLIGPSPYGKFALVENFWETGYGMPSFTLLGPRVLRFPFILTSSYPHEILHNWWGNSVFVDYGAGNWCEGLTAYMADHLLKEQKGQGAEYRRDTLQRYRSYVRAGRDFPLVEFRSRHSAATEAVGYGKTLMGFHMLRRRLGDDRFREWAARFYREFRGRRASFADVRASLEAVSGEDLGRFFTDWVERPGAAELGVSVTGVRRAGRGWEVAGTLEQVQAAAPYRVDVPVVVQTEGPPASAVVRMEGREEAFTVAARARPLALHVDPRFDVFRRLDPRETPPSIGQIFGAPRVLAVVPAGAPAGEVAAWRRLIEGWRSKSHEPEIRTDAEVGELPSDRPVWVLGRKNALAARLFSGAADFTVDAEALTAGGKRMPLAGHTVVIVRRHPADVEAAVGWIFTDTLAALPGLGRKLPHYGRYSYLGFEGEEPTNVLEGQWAATDSPLRLDLRPEGERGSPLPPLVLPAPPPLAELPPVFTSEALMKHVSWLAAPEREGRGIGTEGLDAAAAYVAAELRRIGLAPGGDDGTWFQPFTTTRTPDGRPTPLRNVVGVLPGARGEWKRQSVLLTAHYDHLGRGWPEARAGQTGNIYPGADDNASGVAVLLELARVLADAGRPPRTIVFVAFSGEEAGRLGSRHYVGHPAFPLEKTMGVVNLDTVGRLGGGEVLVLAAGSASEWPHIFRGAGYVTGVATRVIPGMAEASDQESFIDRGVPAVQIFTGAHGDYHRPSDTADEIDANGLVRVASFVREALVYLAEREEPLTSTISTMRGARPAPGSPRPGTTAADGDARAARRVGFGTVPDFAFPGPGVRVAAVVPGSPAEKAGVREGDVVLRFAGKDVGDLRSFARILEGLSPGDAVSVVLLRAGEHKALEATLAAP